MEVQFGFQYGRPRKVPQNNGLVFFRSTESVGEHHLPCTLLNINQLTPPCIRLFTWMQKKQLACTIRRSVLFSAVSKGIYRVYRNDCSGFEVHYIDKYGEQNYKYQ